MYMYILHSNTVQMTICYFCLKGQSHEKVCEIMTSDARIGLN
jgi:hypothetical protein